MLEVKGDIMMKRKEAITLIKNKVPKTIEPKFKDPAELSLEQLTDPDYAIKQLEQLNGGRFSITCSKCHHCR